MDHLHAAEPGALASSGLLQVEPSKNVHMEHGYEVKVLSTHPCINVELDHCEEVNLS